MSCDGYKYKANTTITKNDISDIFRHCSFPFTFKYCGLVFSHTSAVTLRVVDSLWYGEKHEIHIPFVSPKIRLCGFIDTVHILYTSPLWQWLFSPLVQHIKSIPQMVGVTCKMTTWDLALHGPRVRVKLRLLYRLPCGCLSGEETSRKPVLLVGNTKTLWIQNDWLASDSALLLTPSTVC